MEQPNDMLKMLPVLGGVAGGLVYAAIEASSALPAGIAPRGTPVRSPRAHRETSGGSGSSALKKVIGWAVIAGSGLFLFIAGVSAFATWKISSREATTITAAEFVPNETRRRGPGMAFVLV
jgi:hypothetical protein